MCPPLEGLWWSEKSEVDYAHKEDMRLRVAVPGDYGPVLASNTSAQRMYKRLDCEKCDVYIATKNDNQALREKTPKLWAELNNAPILPEHINCEGCRMDGAKTVFCNSLCEVRKCAVTKGFMTCGECPEKDTCPKVGAIWQNNPQAKKNLELL